jgi:hypothetical protein
MAYTINHYSGASLTTVADGTVDTTTDLTLVGKNYAGYGQIQNENFVYLLENFANSSSPSNPLTGQIWFDSGTSKLKFWDGTQFRTTGGAEIGTTAPTGLTQGDFWFDTSTNQLFAWTGTSYVLVGPQAVAGSSTTEMLSTSVKDTNGTAHTVIEAIDNGQIIFVISADSEFTLDSTINPITGFTQIQQGVTLCYTNNNSTPGVTTSSHRFWGTATNADRLGGLSASSYVQAGSAAFSTVVNFADVGYTVGNPVARLRVFNNNASTPTIQNESNNTIVFQTTVGSTLVTPLQLVGADVLPGTTTTSNLGSSSYQWSNVWATTFNGNATSATGLAFNSTVITPSSATSPNTVAIRDNSGNLNATTFNGASTTSYYADLAEKYLPDAVYEPGTVMAVGGNKEVCACSATDIAIGVVSTNPAYMMNSELVGGVYIALKGRVPVKIFGGCSKGDRIVPYGAGWGCSDNNAPGNGNPIFAVALEDCDNVDVALVECVIL